MNWQEACSKSAFGRAFRDSKKGRYFRDADGFATFKGKTACHLRLASGAEIEGFTDWLPVLPKEESND